MFDTETTTDMTQRLTVGCYRYYRAGLLGGLELAEEGLFYADELLDEDPAGLTALRRYAATATTDAPAGRLRLLSRDQFVNLVFYPAAYDARATVVGFNLPFDLSRIAIDASEGRGENRRGFSLILARGNTAKGYREQKHKPRVTVKHLNSHAAFISFGTPYQKTQDWFGEFVDLRTLSFALTGEGHSLDSACRAFGLPGKADPGGYGRITAQHIDYCRTDAQRTAQLYEACLAALAELDLPITAAKAYSPASLAKAVQCRLGVIPDAQRQQPVPPEVLGRYLSAFYGGRAECRIRRQEVPISLVDFTSMYPTLFALMGLWQYCTAERLDTIDATNDVRDLLEPVTLDDVFHQDFWPGLVGIVQLEAAEDILPVRARYDPDKDSYNIGVNHLTSTRPLWYTIAEVVASALLTGKTPRILAAQRLTPIGRQTGLSLWTMPGGRVLDPTIEGPWAAMVEHRQQVRRDQQLDPAQRDRIALFLKITANAGGYGVYAEYNRHDLAKDDLAEVDVYSHTDGYRARVAAPEEPGRFNCSPLAAVITGGARLMLAALERCVSDLGGAWAFADTDSMAIVITPDGGLVPNPGTAGADADDSTSIRALSYAQVDDIRTRFDALNPYRREAVPELLKRELDANCYAIAAKRYALYRYDDHSMPRLVPADEHEPCSHGLGHLLNPTDPDSVEKHWIVTWWETYLAAELRDVHSDIPWLDRPAFGQVAITSPATWRALRHFNNGKLFRQQIKPFGFLLHAPGAADEPGEPAGRLVAPYNNDPRHWLKVDFVDLTQPDRAVRIATDPTLPRRRLIDTYATIAGPSLSTWCEAPGPT